MAYARIIWRLRLAWLAIPLVVGLVFCGVAWSIWTTQSALNRDGIVGESVVIARDLSRQRDSEGNESVTYYITHQYHPETRAEPITQRVSVSRALYERVRQGDALPVTYVWHQPDIATLEPGRHLFGVLLFGIVGAVALAVACIGIALGWPRVRAARRS